MSGMRYWSDSAIRVNPSIDEPSNQVPCSTDPSSWWIGIVTALTWPMMSVNWSWMKRMPCSLAASILALDSLLGATSKVPPWVDGMRGDAQGYRPAPAAAGRTCDFGGAAAARDRTISARRVAVQHHRRRSGLCLWHIPAANPRVDRRRGSRGAGPSTRRSGRPSSGHELIEEAPELPLDVDVAIGPPDDPEPAIRCQPGPDPAARPVEGDRDPGDQQAEGQPDQALAGIPLGDQQGVLRRRRATRRSARCRRRRRSHPPPAPAAGSSARSASRPGSFRSPDTAG